MVELRNWSVFTTPSPNGYMAPELCASRLHGIVYGHPRFEDGVEIDSTRIMEMRVEDGSIVARTRNTEYLLRKREINPNYEAAFPGAFEKIIGGIAKDA